MEFHVAVLHKKQVNDLLECLHKERVLSTKEYDRCKESPTRVKKCHVMLEIVKQKEGGIEKLQNALKSLPQFSQEKSNEDQFEVEDIVIISENDYEHQKILTEKDKIISDLKTENEVLKLELDEKTELESLRTAREKDSVTRRDARHDKKTIEQLNKENVKLKREIRKLKGTASDKEQSMEGVSRLQNLYPYIREVLSCSVHHINLSGDWSRKIPLRCLDMKFDLAKVNTRCCKVDENSLVNIPADIGNINGFRRYRGTRGSIPIMLALSSTTNLPPPLHYWESHTVVELNDRLLSFKTLLEMGVCEEGWVDKMEWVYEQSRSWCIRVGVCRVHRWGICTQIWANKRQYGLCHTHAMSNTPHKTVVLCYGVVVDLRKGRIAFLDLSKGRVLHTFSVTFKDTLYPMFGLEPWAENCYLNMGLMSGDDTMDAYKEYLIRKALQ